MCSLLLSLAITIAAPAPKDAAQVGPAVVGVWKVASAVVGGRTSVEPTVATIEFLPDGGMRFQEGGKDTSNGTTYKVDATKKPAHLDLTSPAVKGGKPRVQLGIYKIEKNILTICLIFSETRPTEFVSADGSGVIMLTLERKPKD